MGWAVWLSVPAVATLTVALGAWWRARPSRTPDLDETVRAHRAYLEALAVPAEGALRPDQP